MPLFKFSCAYDGSEFHGWQKQPEVPSVQGELQNQFSDFFQSSLTIYGSGRTDRGVHALAQFGHFDLSTEKYENFSVSKHRWVEILNRLLPESVRIRSLSQVETGFHSRHSAKYRLYGYRLTPAGGAEKQMFADRAHTWSRPEFSYSDARAAVKLLNGGVPTEVFSGQGGSGYEAEHWPLELSFKKVANSCWLLVLAPSFRYLMVRCLARAVAEVASGRWPVDELRKLIDQKDRTVKPAPPGGCYLIRVFYHAVDPGVIFSQGIRELKYFFK